MNNGEKCNKEPMDKLSKTEEAALLWDEYKYRHDLIWKHLIRSTIAVVILITVPYSTDLIQDEYLVGGSSIAALIYLCHTFLVILRENKLLENVKDLHRKRQMHYLKLPQKEGFPCDNERSGGFLGRIVWYLIFLLLLVIYAIFINMNIKDSITLMALQKANISFKDLSNSGITVSDLIQPKMTIDKLKSLLKKMPKHPTLGKPEYTDSIDSENSNQGRSLQGRV